MLIYTAVLVCVGFCRHTRYWCTLLLHWIWCSLLVHFPSHFQTRRVSKRWLLLVFFHSTSRKEKEELAVSLKVCLKNVQPTNSKLLSVTLKYTRVGKMPLYFPKCEGAFDYKFDYKLQTLTGYYTKKTQQFARRQHRLLRRAHPLR